MGCFRPDQVYAMCAAAQAVICAESHADWATIRLAPSGWSNTKVYAVTVANQFGEGASPAPSSTYQALSWSGTPAGFVVMTPGVGNGGSIYYSRGDSQVGIYTGGHAALWHGSPTPVDLHPASYWTSTGRAIWQGQQFGDATLTESSYPVAAMWFGTATSFVNLNPPGSSESAISGAWGGQQGGYAYFGGYRAGLWNGTPQSFVVLHPGPPYLSSGIGRMAQGEQSGNAIAASSFNHAALWHGTATSFVDLDPGWDYSFAYDTLGGVEVGWTTLDFSNNTHAVIWFGTAASYHDLSQYLPAGYHDSVATAIATDGVRYYVGGYGSPPGSTSTEAFLWIGDVPGACYANCDSSTAPPLLNVADFSCFLQRFVSGDTYANCDLSTTPPVLNVQDFTCYLRKFAAGCP
jgi:hypothetical protein